MEEQLPVPLSELIVFILFLASFAFLLAVILLGLILKVKDIFSWPLLVKQILVLIVCCILGIITAFILIPDFALEMLGPFHIPTTIVATVFLVFIGATKKKQTLPKDT